MDRAQRREVASIVWDVLTNLACIAVGVWGLVEVLGGRKSSKDAATCE